MENRPGAGGIVGARSVADTAPDGRMLLYRSTSPIVIAPQLRDPGPNDTAGDFETVMIALKGQSILVVNLTLPIESAPDLIAYAKEHPGELSVGREVARPICTGG